MPCRSLVLASKLPMKSDSAVSERFDKGLLMLLPWEKLSVILWPCDRPSESIDGRNPFSECPLDSPTFMVLLGTLKLGVYGPMEWPEVRGSILRVLFLW